MTQETRLRVASNPTRGWQANKKTHLCVASGIRAMPETEKPPAMRVDIYCKFGCIYLRWEMYQIGICDDGKNTCAFIEDVVLKYGKKRNVKMDIQVWNSGEELWCLFRNGKTVGYSVFGYRIV